MSTWIKLLDSMPEHPDVMGLPDSAFRSFIQALAYCSRNRTDGWVPEPAARTVMQRPKDPEALIEAGLLVARTGGWLVVNYLDHQRSRAQIDVERTKARARKQKQRGDTTIGNVTALSRRDIGGTSL
jgi:hypothetical protein